MQNLGYRVLLRAVWSIAVLMLSSTLALSVGGDEKYGGEIVIPLNGEPKLLNPILRGELAGTIVNAAVFEGLAKADPKTMESRPAMATGWEYNDDYTVLTVHLRPGQKWHDGAPVTSEDVKFTYEKVMEPDTITTFAVQVSSIDSIEVVDDSTAKFHLKHPDSAFVAALQIGLIPKHILDGEDVNRASFNHDPVGAGPFKFEEWVPGDHITLVANEDYHQGRPYLDKLVFKVIPDSNVRLAQIRTGEIDVMDAVEPDQLAQLARVPGLTIHKMVQANYYGLFINPNKAPFDDIRVREALNHAIDKQTIVDKVLKGEAQLASSVFPTAFGWAFTDDVKTQDFDPEKAKQLLAEAGWKDTDGDGILDRDGKPFAFTLTGDNGSAVRRQVVIIAAQYLQQIGLKTEIQFKPWNDFLENFQWNPDKEMTFLWNAFNPPLDPDAMARRWESTSGPRGNQTRYNNPEVDRLFAEARRTSDQEKRQQAYFKIQKEIADDVPFIILYYPMEIEVTTDKLKGVVPSPFRIYHDMNGWYLEK